MAFKGPSTKQRQLQAMHTVSREEIKKIDFYLENSDSRATPAIIEEEHKATIEQASMPTEKKISSLDEQTHQNGDLETGPNQQVTGVHGLNDDSEDEQVEKKETKTEAVVEAQPEISNFEKLDEILNRKVS